MFSFLLVFCTLFTHVTHAATTPDMVDRFLDETLRPLLKGRESYYTVQVKRGKEPVITLYSGKPNMWMGRYTIRLHSDQAVLPVGAPNLKLEWGQYNGTALQKITGEIDLPPRAEGLQDKLRSLLRADQLLHPMLTPPGLAPSLAPVQQDIVQQLHVFHREALARNEGTRALMIAATGFGKTVISAIFLRDLIRDGRPFKVVFVIQNNEVLIDASMKMQQLLGIKSAEVRRLFGDNNEEHFLNGGAKLIVSSRTKMHRNLDKLRRERQEYNGRVFYIFDEAHHLGKVDGEFNDILEAVDADLRAGDVLLGATATPWHTDSDIIERIFRNHIAAALITPEEKAQFIRERRLIYMARLILFRAIAQGYLSPIQRYKQIRYLEGDSDEVRILARNYLNDWTLKFEGLDEAERLVLMRKEIKVHMPFVKTVIREIRGSISHDESGKPLYHNRGIIFVPSIAHADVYAHLISMLSPPGKDKIYARAFHSNAKQSVRDSAMDWFMDGEKSRIQDRRVVHHELKVTIHKYLVVVNSLGEGFDYQKVNHLVLAKDYSDLDEIGMRELLQNLGRGSRLNYAKLNFLISDFTGAMRRLVFHGLDQALVKDFFISGTKNQLDDEVTIQAIDEPNESVTTRVTLDHQTLREKNFKSEDVEVPHEILSKAEVTSPAKTPNSITPALKSESLEPDMTKTEEEILLAGHARSEEDKHLFKRLTWKELDETPGSALLFVEKYKSYSGSEERAEWTLNDLRRFADPSFTGKSPLNENETRLVRERLIGFDLQKLPAYRGFDPAGNLSPISLAMIMAVRALGKDRISEMGYPILACLDHALSRYKSIFKGAAFVDEYANYYKPEPQVKELMDEEVNVMSEFGYTKETLPEEFKRMTWVEFLSRPGSARFIFSDLERELKRIASEHQLSVNDLIAMTKNEWNGPELFTPRQIGYFAGRTFPRRVKLQRTPYYRGRDSNEFLSPFMPAHFHNDIRAIDSRRFSELYSLSSVESLYTLAEPGMKGGEKDLFRVMTWRAFVRRPGSAFFLFHPDEITLINIAASARLSIDDVQWANEKSKYWSLYSPAIWNGLKLRIEMSRIPKTDNGALSNFSPAHFLFVPYNFLGPEFLSRRPIFEVLDEHHAREKVFTFMRIALDEFIPEVRLYSHESRESTRDRESRFKLMMLRVKEAKISANLRAMPLIRDIYRLKTGEEKSPLALDQPWSWAKLLVHPAGQHAFALKHPNLRGQIHRLREMREGLLKLAISPLEKVPEESSNGPFERGIMHDVNLENRNMLRRRVQENLHALAIRIFDKPGMAELADDNSRAMNRRPSSPEEVRALVEEFAAQERRLIELFPELAAPSSLTTKEILQKPMYWEGYARPSLPREERPENMEEYFRYRRDFEVYLATRGVPAKEDYLSQMLMTQFALLELPELPDKASVDALETHNSWTGNCEDLMAARKAQVPEGLGEATGGDFGAWPAAQVSQGGEGQGNADKPKKTRSRRLFLRSPWRI